MSTTKVPANKIICVLGGGLARDKKTGRWRSTRYHDPGATPMAYGDYLRVVAALYLYKRQRGPVVASGGHGRLKNVPLAVTLAGVIRSELVKSGVKRKDVIIENHSGNTYEQLRALAAIARQGNFKKVDIISNAYHLPRVKAMAENFQELKDVFKGISLGYVSAEKISLKYRPRLWSRVIEMAYQSASMREIIKRERQGVRQIKSGTYQLPKN